MNTPDTISCYARRRGRQLTLGNDSIRIVWTEMLGELRARVAGGIWARKGSAWRKIADLAEGEPALVPWDAVVALPPGEQRLDPLEFAKTQPREATVSGDGTREAVVTLSGGTLASKGVDWRVDERWSVRSGEPILRWSFAFTPSAAVEDRCLLNVRFNVLPHRFRTITLPSCCGFDDEIAYAIFPERDDPFWMRLEGAKLITNTFYSFTYKPTKLADGSRPVTIRGCFLADELTPAELHARLHEHLRPSPDEPARTPEAMMQAAVSCIRRSFDAARATGHFASGEGALIGGFYPDGTRHYHMRGRKTAYDVGFSLGWCGQALSPLLMLSERTADPWARDAAVRIGTWICSHAQTEYGAFHEIYDIEANQGADFMCEDLLYCHTTARNAAELLRLHRATNDATFLRCGLKACDWLRGVQEPTGAIQWKFVDSTGESEYPPSYAAATLEVLAAWAQAFEVTSDRRYLAAGRRLAAWGEREFVNRNRYGGFITDDLYSPAPTNGLNRWETQSPTAICFLIDGYLEFHRVTRDPRYLEIAERAGKFWGLYQWLWEFPTGCLKMKVKGTTQASGGMPYCIDQTFGSELPLELETLADLAAATRDDAWLGMLRMAMARMSDFQHSDEASPMYGAIIEGWSNSRDIVLPGMQGNMLFTNRVPSVMIKYLRLVPRGASPA